jgi:GTP-binding protein
LSRLSRARPRIAAYPFTTLQPELGIVELSGERRMVLADIPGLIAGAHQGAGLGDAFLRHIERTRVIVHLVDTCPVDGASPAAAYDTVRRELAAYSAALAEKPELVVAAKIDLAESDAPACDLAEAIGVTVLPVSAVSGQGLEPLTERLWTMLSGFHRETPPKRYNLPTPPHSRSDA